MIYYIYLIFSCKFNFYDFMHKPVNYSAHKELTNFPYHIFHASKHSKWRKFEGTDSKDEKLMVICWLNLIFQVLFRCDAYFSSVGKRTNCNTFSSEFFLLKTGIVNHHWVYLNQIKNISTCIRNSNTSTPWCRIEDCARYFWTI